MYRCTSIWMIGHKTRMFEVAFRMLLRHSFSFHSRFKSETHESTRFTHTCSHAHVFQEHGHLCSYAHTRVLTRTCVSEVPIHSQAQTRCVFPHYLVLPGRARRLCNARTVEGLLHKAQRVGSAPMQSTETDVGKTKIGTTHMLTNNCRRAVITRVFL